MVSEGSEATWSPSTMLHAYVVPAEKRGFLGQRWVLLMNSAGISGSLWGRTARSPTRANPFLGRRSPSTPLQREGAAAGPGDGSRQAIRSFSSKPGMLSTTS